MATRATASDVRPGSRLFNNDPRVAADNPRKNVYVLKVTDTGVIYHTGGRAATIKFDRIFTDGKARHQGYNLQPLVVQSAGEDF